jgi:hypothetical protein
MHACIRTHKLKVEVRVYGEWESFVSKPKLFDRKANMFTEEN